MLRAAFYASRFASQTGQGVFLAVLVVMAGGADSSALGLSAMLIAVTTGSVLFGLPAGVLIDRIGAPRALLTGALLRLLVIGATTIAVGRAEYAALFAFAYSAVSQVFSPAELALVRTLNPEAAGETHAALIALQYAAQGIGLLALAPALHAWGGLPPMIAGAIAAYVIVVGIAGFLDRRLPPSPPVARRRGALAWAETVSYVSHEHRAVYAAALLTFAEVATKGLIVIVPAYFKDELGLAPIQAGVVGALGLMGVTVGLGWGGRRTTTARAPREMRSALAISTACVFALAGLSGVLTSVGRWHDVGAVGGTFPFDVGFTVAAMAAVVLGLCAGVAPVSARTVFSVTAPAGMQGRIFATQAVATDVLTIAPVLAVGAMSDAGGPRLAMAFLAALGLALLAVLEVNARRLRRTAGRQNSIPD